MSQYIQRRELLTRVYSPKEAGWGRWNQGPVSDSKEGGEGRERFWKGVEIPVHFYAKELVCKWQANHFKTEAVALKNVLDFFFF